LSSSDYPLLSHRPDCDEVIFSSCYNEPSIRRPRETQESTKVTPHPANQLHGIIVKDSQESILTDSCNEFATGREGKFIDATFSNDPSVQRIPGALCTTSVDRESISTLEDLIVRRSCPTREIFFIDIKLSRGMGDEEDVR
jgi:hypothetical protein